MVDGQTSGHLAGKVALVTGATSGIGAITARALAGMGATVIVVGRSAAKGQATVDEIRRATGNGAVEALTADLSSQADVRKLAARVVAGHPKLDILVNNAGAMFTKRRESVDGIEMTLALNHLGYFLLTDLLLDPLKAAGSARVVVVSSDAHKMVRRLDLDDLQSRKSYGGLSVYSKSKLLNILFTRELARRLAGTGVTANCLHPGVVATNFAVSDNGLAGKLIRKAFDLFSISAEQGADTPIYLASSPEVEGVTGRYFTKRKDVEPTKLAQDDGAARRLWELSESLVGATARA